MQQIQPAVVLARSFSRSLGSRPVTRYS